MVRSSVNKLKAVLQVEERSINKTEHFEQPVEKIRTVQQYLPSGRCKNKERSAEFFKPVANAACWRRSHSATVPSKWPYEETTRRRIFRGKVHSIKRGAKDPFDASINSVGRFERRKDRCLLSGFAQ